jgi:hypothetical protein
MIEIGVFHNGASDLPAVTTPEGVVVNDGAWRRCTKAINASSSARFGRGFWPIGSGLTIGL